MMTQYFAKTEQDASTLQMLRDILSPECRRERELFDGWWQGLGLPHARKEYAEIFEVVNDYVFVLSKPESEKCTPEYTQRLSERRRQLEVFRKGLNEMYLSDLRAIR